MGLGYEKEAIFSLRLQKKGTEHRGRNNRALPALSGARGKRLGEKNEREEPVRGLLLCCDERRDSIGR